jgi:hypothetical protein
LDRSRAQVLIELVAGRNPLGQGARLVAQRLFERADLLTSIAGQVFGRRDDLVGFFLGLEQRFLLPGFRVALGVAHDSGGLLLGASDGFGGDAPAVREPIGENGHRG